MNFAAPKLCQRLYELTRKSAYWAWDCTGPEPVIVRAGGNLGNGIWPAYMLRDLWDMNPRATTWFKKETNRLGGTCSARTERAPHFMAHDSTPENAAATLQISVETDKRARR